MWGWIEMHASAVALAVSMGAFCVSVLSIWLTWRRDRKSEQAIYPLVEVNIAPYAIEPGIHAVTLAVWNRRDHHVYIKGFAVRRPRRAAFVAHQDRNEIEPPTIFRDRRERVRAKNVCLFQRGNPGSHWSEVTYLDIGSNHDAVTILFEVEFDFIDRRKRRARISIKKTVGKTNPKAVHV